MGEMTLSRSSAVVFFVSRCLGERSWLHCSASRVSLVQVRAMSNRMVFTRAFELCSANSRHSAE
jgi:hypothetical protein